MHRVVLLTIGETEAAQPARDRELLDYLSRHGVRSERIAVTPDRRSIGVRLLHEATILNAGILVIGAYSHSPIREAFLGSTTRDVIAHAVRPVLHGYTESASRMESSPRCPTRPAGREARL